MKSTVLCVQSACLFLLERTQISDNVRAIRAEKACFVLTQISSLGLPFVCPSAEARLLLSLLS